ncbi:MAG: PAS domain S-box protein [Candidatus Aminicenantes bacterium]|nr:PAS domain S-box protein [Candidatus Aminicenantes bacterium]
MPLSFSRGSEKQNNPAGKCGLGKMEKKYKRNGAAAGLRRRAEEKFRGDDAKASKKLTQEETQKMLYELRVHQIELEMQNEELRRMQTELETARARYFDLYDLAPVGYCTLSEQGLLLEVNLTAATLLGMPRGALSKQPLTQFISKEDQDIYYLHRKQLFETGETQTCELRIAKHDGTAFWALLQASVAPDDNGVRVCRIVLSDISERKQIEEIVKKNEENFQRLLEDSPLGVRIVTDKGETIYANRTILGLYGYGSMDEINRIPLKARYTPQSYEEFHARVKAREQGDFGPREYKIAIIRKNGEIRHLQAFRKEILWNGNKQFQVIYNDITERECAEEKLRNSLVEKEVLLKEVHHRVKNNLMIIIGLIKMEETKAHNEMLNPFLQELEGRIRSMAQVHESLYLSKYLTHIDLQNYIEMISAHIHAQFGSEHNVYFSVQADGVMVSLDKAISCGLILNELITNAFKHAFPVGTPVSGAGRYEINVIAVQGSDELILTVANNGVGLPADFEWEKSETLGLQLVKMLIKQIDGSIELDRSAGTAFRVKFPVA